SERSRRLDISMPDEGPTQRVYFYSASGEEKALISLFHDLVEHGAKHVNCFLPNTIVCELPAGSSAQAFVRDPGITVLPEAQVEEGDDTGRTFGPGWAKHCYKLAEQPPAIPYDPYYDPAVDLAEEAAPLEASILEVPMETVRRTEMEPSDDYPDPRNIMQNSELLLGSILVQLILPESSPHPANNENWTANSEAAALSQAVSATIYYQSAYEKVPMNFVFNKLTKVLTTVEPIKYPLNDTEWIKEVMTVLGYPDDGSPDRDLTAVHEFNNDKRKEYGAQWVFTAFIVNAEKDPDHRFENTRKIGRSFLGGPYLVLPYPGPHCDMVGAFEYFMGSMFWALGEDLGSPYGCDDYSGYLDYQNRNKTVGYDPITGMPKSCPGIRLPDPCCMSWVGWSCSGGFAMNSSGPMGSSSGNEPCEFTAGQFGLLDKKPRNGVPDCLDAPPVVYFENSAVETVFTQNAVIRFQVVSEGVPNENRRQEPDQRVTYKVPVKFVGRSENGLITQKILPIDGVYDELVEDFAFEMEQLPGGASRFALVTKNAANSQSEEQAKELFYIGLSYLQFGFQNRNQGVWLEWRLLGDTFDAKLDVHRIDVEDGGKEEIVASALGPIGPRVGSFTPYGFMDKSVVRGVRYRYYVTGTLTASYRDADTTVTTVTHEVETRAMYPITEGNLLSEAVPNPFSEHTLISVKVPPSYRHLEHEFPQPIPTDVKVTIYDVLGRRVKEVFSDTIYGQVVTIPWDGTNDNNERVPAGVYFIKTVAGAEEDARKIVLVR
ncbi:MAG: FlgD immunoglobulin-like domain containing protein, partial [bacterium]